MGLDRIVLDVLVASLWQGGCIALVVFAVVRIAGHRLNASTACLVFQVSLVAVIMVPLITTVSSLTTVQPIDASAAVRAKSATIDSRTIAASSPMLSRTFQITTNDTIARAVVVAWAVGVAFLLFRLAGGTLRLIGLVQRSRVFATRGRIRLGTSDTCTVPLAIGLLNPMIVVPTTLVAQSDDTLESVLQHELAHIQRRDAWAHAIERLVHAIFYFNPVVLVLLRAIELERESACDDVAVANLQDGVAYTQNLARFALARATGAQHACGATGFNHAVVTRVRRLEDARHDGAVALSRSAIGGFSMVLISLVIGLQAFAPAVAFAPPPVIAVLSNPCKTIVRGPKFPQATFPTDLSTTVNIQVATPGGAPFGTIVSSSGNARFDAAVRSYAELFVAATGSAAPPSCSTVPMNIQVTIGTFYDAQAKSRAFRLSWRDAKTGHRYTLFPKT